MHTLGLFQSIKISEDALYRYGSPATCFKVNHDCGTSTDAIEYIASEL